MHNTPEYVAMHNGYVAVHNTPFMLQCTTLITLCTAICTEQAPTLWPTDNVNSSI